MVVAEVRKRFSTASTLDEGKAELRSLVPQRDVPREVRAPSTSAELQEIQERAVERAILDKRRHQYLQEYPGGPIDRYLPPSDPYAFLIEAEKLTPEERRWQVHDRRDASVLASNRLRHPCFVV